MTQLKQPPQDIELEKAVLGALLLENTDDTQEALSYLTEDSFYKDSHKVIFKAITTLKANDMMIDTILVLKELKKAKNTISALELAELTQRIESSANIVHYSIKLNEEALKRHALFISRNTIKETEEGKDVFEVITDAQTSLDQLQTGNYNTEYTGEKAANLYLEKVERVAKGEAIGIPSGFSEFDSVIHNLQPKNFYIAAARPAMGKTADALQIAKNVCEQGKGVHLFSLEMGAEQLIGRLKANVAEVYYQHVADYKFTSDEMERILKAASTISNYNLIIDDEPAITVQKMKSKILKNKKKNNTDLVIVDYLQLMTGDKNGNREQEIASISRGLKGLAKSLDLPVLALVQLSRSVETRGGDKKPILSDLRESGQIEQDADMVYFLYRPSYYGITEDENGVLPEGYTEKIIAKNRHGKTGALKFIYQGNYMRFKEYNGIHQVQEKAPF